LLKTVENTEKTYDKLSENLYPNVAYKFVPWTSAVSATPYSDALGSGVSLRFQKLHGGAYLDLNGEKSADSYSKLYVYYWPGTCLGTGVYFDSYSTGMELLRNNAVADGNFLVKEIPLSDIIDAKITHNHRKITSRLVFANVKTDEVCSVYRILAK
jgi:hypothetical protein